MRGNAGADIPAAGRARKMNSTPRVMTLDDTETASCEVAFAGVKMPNPRRSNMNREFVEIDNSEILAGLEAYVFKKRSQRARKQRLQFKG